MGIMIIQKGYEDAESAKIYKELWDMWGGNSPLLTYGKKLQELVQKNFQDQNITVEFAMRYQNPSLDSVIVQEREAPPHSPMRKQ